MERQVLIREIVETDVPARAVTLWPAAAGGELHSIWLIMVYLREGEGDATEDQAEGHLQYSWKYG